MGEYAKALSYYEKVIEIREKNLPANHDHLAISYINIALQEYMIAWVNTQKHFRTMKRQ